MSDPAGWIPAYRRAFEPDHWLAPTKRAPASKLHAWLDLCQLATWQPRETYRSGTLLRGEIVVSMRTLGERWKWGKDAVRDFLNTLETKTAIQTVRQTPDGTVYRIVKYDTYAIWSKVEPDSNQDGEPDRSQTEARQEQEVKHSRTADSRPRKHRLPDGWVPTEGHRRRAASEGVDLEREAEKFRDHAIANGRTQLDWDRAFNTWLMRAAEFGARQNGNGTASHANPKARGRL